MEIAFENITLKETKISFTIAQNLITGITGNNQEEIKRLLSLKTKDYSKIRINGEEVTSNNIKQHCKKIVIIDSNINPVNYGKKNYDIMLQEIMNNGLVLKDYEKKIIDSLKIVGIKQSVLNKYFTELSSSEQKLFKIAVSLLHNPEVIIIEEPFKGLDLKNEKRISMVLQKMRDEYNKTIVFISENSEELYRYTDYLIAIKNEKIIIEGKTTEVYQKVPLLNRNKITVPEIVSITYLAKKNKNIKLNYHKDVRDIIKDIYKHV